MSNSTTEQKATSQDKSIIQGIGFKEFSSICQEYQIVEKATKELLEIANDKNTPVRTKVDIYKWVVEMNVGKPRQISEEKTKEEQGIQRYEEIVNLVRFGKSKLNIFTKEEYYEATIDPNDGTDWNYNPIIDTKPKLEDFALLS